MEQLEANKWWVWMKSSGNNILGHYHHHHRLPPHLAPAPPVTKFNGIGGAGAGGIGSSRTWEKEYSSCITSSSWPPRFYSCSFCKREFRSAQALGGHMNVHRRDRALLHQIPAAASCTTNECHDTQAHNCSIKDHFDSLVAPLCPPCPNGHRSKPKCLELKQTPKVSLSSSSSSSQNRSAVRRYRDNNEQFNAVGGKNELGCKLLRARTKPSVLTSGAALENMSRKNGMNHPPKANAVGGKEEALICCSKRQRKGCNSSSAAAGSLLPPTMSSPCPKQQRYNCSSTSQVQFGLKSSTSSASTSMVELDLELRLGDPSSL